MDLGEFFLEKINNWMENDGIRIQMEAEEKRELSEIEWKSIVSEYAKEVIDRMQELSMTMRDAYLDIIG